MESLGVSAGCDKLAEDGGCGSSDEMEVGTYEDPGRRGVGVNVARRDLWLSKATCMRRDWGVGENDINWWMSS